MADLLSKRIAIPADVLVNQVAGESVLLNLDGGGYFGLDEVGTDMWKALTAAPSIAQALEILTAQYEVDPATLRNDIEDLIHRLADHGLVRIEDR